MTQANGSGLLVERRWSNGGVWVRFGAVYRMEATGSEPGTLSEKEADSGLGVGIAIGSESGAEGSCSVLIAKSLTELYNYDKWSSAYDVRKILLSIQSLLGVCHSSIAIGQGLVYGGDLSRVAVRGYILVLSFFYVDSDVQYMSRKLSDPRKQQDYEVKTTIDIKSSH
ncbi:hypothetical protein G4B88_004983, partial [Cannabis sativa]